MQLSVWKTCPFRFSVTLLEQRCVSLCSENNFGDKLLEDVGRVLWFCSFASSGAQLIWAVTGEGELLQVGSCDFSTHCTQPGMFSFSFYKIVI